MSKSMEKKAMDAIEDLFGDTSVPAEATLESLERIQDRVNEFVELLTEQTRG